MPKQGENVFPVPVSADAASDLKTVMGVSGLAKTHVLRYAIEAALRTLAQCDHVRLPIQFKIEQVPAHPVRRVESKTTPRNQKGQS